MKNLEEMFNSKEFQKEMLEKKSKEEIKKLSLDDIFKKMEQIYENQKD